MVTLAERISESEPRRSRQLPGSPCTLAVQDATAVKPVHAYPVTAPYPQGSTAIPACETNYPVAAAQPRPPASAKFRPVSGVSGRLYINSENTYQFVMSNPVVANNSTGEFGVPGLAFDLVWKPSEGLHQTEGWEKKTLQLTDPVAGMESSTVASVVSGPIWNRKAGFMTLTAANTSHPAANEVNGNGIISRISDAVFWAAGARERS
jgi:hypothetical protein